MPQEKTMRKKYVPGSNGAVIKASRKSTLKSDAPDRGDETRVAHACTFLVKAGWSLPGAAWSVEVCRGG